MEHIVEWQAPEYIYTEKTGDWYWIVGIVTISIFIISIILDNLIFGILILAASLALSLHASRKPETINISIGKTGVQVGDILYPYNDLLSFWVETGDRYPRAILKSKKTLMPFLVLLLSDVDPDDVEHALLIRLPEEHHSETLMEKILIRLGF